MLKRFLAPALATLALGLATGGLPAPAAANTLAPRPAPDFTLPQRGATAPVQLSKLRGQVVMINFWASWCGPCRQEFPILDEMYRKYRPMGFNLLAVNVEPDPKDADRFLAKTPASFPILLDAKNELSKLYNVNAMPTTVLVDRKGNLRWVHRGYKPGDENEYLNQVRALLRER
ncbi:MAG: TlpA disulfide reductase family protein [Steroidobacteraceae bacterium]|jgi:thiol-disulfide isomerase/thioredoxin|nr:TlpA disulfide reductase family protein [Steroidobacteraceae bacterium]